MSALVITGASSFLSHALLSNLPEDRFSELRLLVHEQPVPVAATDRRVIAVKGNLLDAKTLRPLLTPGATVIHLAYLATSNPEVDNLAAVRNLLAACNAAGIKRMIHCSTAVVAGNVSDDVITEDTVCRPSTTYERVKYRIEQEMRGAAAGRHEITILRPTAVFGPRGRNLIKLANDLRAQPAFVNYLKSCLQGSRRMNLVHVDNVVAALAFLIGVPGRMAGEVFIISDDEAPGNNFRDVERCLMAGLGVPDYPNAPAALPRWLLSAALRAAGRTNTNPFRVYDCSKIVGRGLKKPVAFDQGLADFASWCRDRNPDQAAS